MRFPKHNVPCIINHQRRSSDLNIIDVTITKEEELNMEVLFCILGDMGLILAYEIGSRKSEFSWISSNHPGKS
jgi:hypothetical protein